jgi:hypothetical protein
MKEKIRIGVIVPAGPRDDVMDTLESVVHYSDRSRKIVVIDDTGTLHLKMDEIRKISSDITVISAPEGAPGSQGGLWVKLTAGYRWMLERYEPRIVLRLDADALIIGYGLEEKAEQEFAKNPAIGILGACRIGPDGGRRDLTVPARMLWRETGILGLVHPECRAVLRYFRGLAHQNGYVGGESALGGAYIHPYNVVLDLYNRGWLDRPCLAASRLGEDHIMSMLIIAAGYELGEFSRPGDPGALKLRGLPAHPEELLAAGKLVTHSVRYWQDLREQEIRSIFARARSLVS